MSGTIWEKMPDLNPGGDPSDSEDGEAALRALARIFMESFATRKRGKWGRRKRRVLPTKLCYEATEWAPGHPGTEELRKVLNSHGERIGQDDYIDQGLAFHNTQVITRVPYYMKNADDSLIKSRADCFAPHIPDIIQVEYGPGEGIDAENFVKIYGKPFGYIGVDRSQHNLDLTREKLKALGLDDDRILMLHRDFYTDRDQLKADIKAAIRNWGNRASSHFILGGTPYNVRAEQRVPFFGDIHELVSYEPTDGRPNKLFVTTDWTQDRLTLLGAYEHPSYLRFYLSGLFLGCYLNELRMNMKKDHLSYFVHFDGKGIVTQLVNKIRQGVTNIPTERTVFTLMRMEHIDCTIAEKPRPQDCIQEFRDAGWEMIPGASSDEQTMAYRDDNNPEARVGICVLDPVRPPYPMHRASAPARTG